MTTSYLDVNNAASDEETHVVFGTGSVRAGVVLQYVCHIIVVVVVVVIALVFFVNVSLYVYIYRYLCDLGDLRCVNRHK